MFSFSPGVPWGEHFSSTAELNECAHVPEAGATVKDGVSELLPFFLVYFLILLGHILL